MSDVVIDTNVLVVANGRTPQASLDCQEACVARLVTVRESETTLLDDLGLVLKEYIGQRLSFSGQPGVGDQFFKWLFENQANPQHTRTYGRHSRYRCEHGRLRGIPDRSQARELRRIR